MKNFFAFLIVFLIKSICIESLCNTCDPTSKVACISSTQYFTCDATTMTAITTTLNTCAGTSVCTDTAAICVTGGTATCTSPVLPVFLPAIWTPAKFCSTRIDGRHPYTLEAGCKKYVHCYTYNGNKLGQVLSCPGPNLVFDPLNDCVPSTSYTCV